MILYNAHVRLHLSSWPEVLTTVPPTRWIAHLNCLSTPLHRLYRSNELFYRLYYFVNRTMHLRGVCGLRPRTHAPQNTIELSNCVYVSGGFVCKCTRSILHVFVWQIYESSPNGRREKCHFLNECAGKITENV